MRLCAQGRPGGNGAQGLPPLLSTGQNACALRAGQAGMPAVATGILACPQEGRRQPPALRIQALRPGSARQTWRKWSTGLTGLCSLLGRQECLHQALTWRAGRPGGNGAQGYRPVLSTGQAGMPTLPKAWLRLNAGRQTCREMEHRPYRQCSLLGRQECLPYLRQPALPGCGRVGFPGGWRGRYWRLQGRPGRNGAQALPPCALYWAGKNAYLT